MEWSVCSFSHLLIYCLFEMYRGFFPPCYLNCVNMIYNMNSFIYIFSVVLQVRTLEVQGSSADKIKNFENNFLGEVRILGALKHPCIVEIYGHQILSQWTLSADGGPEHRVLRSAIFMEYVDGGSLKVRFPISIAVTTDIFFVVSLNLHFFSNRTISRSYQKLVKSMFHWIWLCILLKMLHVLCQSCTQSTLFIET